MKNFTKFIAFVSFFLSSLFIAKAQYCFVSPYPSCNIGAYITNVSVGSINRTSACDNYINTGVQTDLFLGANVPMTVDLHNINASQLRVFIDYNRDSDFCDAGELVYNLYDSRGPGNYTESFNFMVPSGAVLGVTRMRVIVDYLGGIAVDLFDACGGGNTSCNAGSSSAEFSGTGEVQDYYINIAGVPDGVNLVGHSPFNFAVSPNPFDDNLNLSFSGVSNEPVRIEIADITGSRVYSETIKPAGNHVAIPFNIYADGVYFCKVTSGQETRTLKVMRISK